MRTIEEIDKDLEVAWDRINELIAEKKEVEFSEFPDFINKFWEIITPFGNTTYLHVYEFFKSGTDIVIRGNGFEWENTQYWDACSMYWTWARDIIIHERNIKEYFSNKENFKEITKEEFKQKYQEMISEMSKRFDEITDIDYNEE